MLVISHDIRFQYHAWSNQLIPKSLWRSFLPELHSLSHWTLIQILMCKDNSYAGTNPYLQHHLSPCRYLRGLINWILNYPHKNIFKSWSALSRKNDYQNWLCWILGSLKTLNNVLWECRWPVKKLSTDPAPFACKSCNKRAFLYKRFHTLQEQRFISKLQLNSGTPENSANHVQDEKEDQHNLISSPVDVMKGTTQFSVHSPAGGKQDELFANAINC